MLDSGTGLSSVPTEDLRRLLRGVFRGDLPCPLDARDLARHGLQERQELLLGALRGLDLRAVQAVLVCVLAERKAAS